MIRAHNVRFIRGQNVILDGVEWSASRGEHWVMLGPNGSGKSTLIKVLTLYEWPTSGAIEAFGIRAGSESVSVMRQRMGLFEPSLHESIAHHYPTVTAREVVAAGAVQALALYVDLPERVWRKAESLLSEDGLEESRAFSVMSSGEQRRTLLLRALINSPDLLILDEPFESLDMKARFTLENSLRRLAREVSTLTALHRVEEIPEHATHALLLKDGRVFAQGPVDDVLRAEILSGLYGLELRLEKSGRRFACWPA